MSCDAELGKKLDDILRHLETLPTSEETKDLLEPVLLQLHHFAGALNKMVMKLEQVYLTQRRDP